jgi:glycosyltransferase involved in cell wall biosynthesis
MGQLPPNIHTRYRGAISDEQIDLFSDYHLFLFPTHGENFGYVIQEALLGGCLPLISTNTPWRGLADKRVGWDVTDEAEFVRIIEQAIQMDGATFAEWSKNAQAYGMSVVNDPKRVAQNRDLFR